jgi:hypothetical protein
MPTIAPRIYNPIILSVLLHPWIYLSLIMYLISLLCATVLIYSYMAYPYGNNFVLSTAESWQVIV